MNKIQARIIVYCSLTPLLARYTSLIAAKLDCDYGYVAQNIRRLAFNGHIRVSHHHRKCFVDSIAPDAIERAKAFLSESDAEKIKEKDKKD